MNITDSDRQRFFDKVQIKENGCWEWTGHCLKKGYGTFWLHGNVVKSHRFSWTLTNGEIPSGMEVLHKCDNPPCVNPEHLFLGKDVDNARDCISKGRWRKTKLTKNQVLEIRKALLNYQIGMINQLAKTYHVSRKTIYKIKNAKTWRY